MLCCCQTTDLETQGNEKQKFPSKNSSILLGKRNETRRLEKDAKQINLRVNERSKSQGPGNPEKKPQRGSKRDYSTDSSRKGIPAIIEQTMKQFKFTNFIFNKSGELAKKNPIVLGMPNEPDLQTEKPLIEKINIYKSQNEDEKQSK